MSNRIAALSVFAVTALLSSPAWASPPKFDGSDIGGYMKALQRSDDPEAKTILKQIADGPSDLKRERLLTQQAGIPLVAPAPNVPADQNAAPLYARWEELRKQRNVTLPNYAETLNYRYKYTPEQIARVQKIFDDNRDIFDLLHQAADKPSLAYPLPSGNADPAGSFPIFAKIREAAREINTESDLLARAGRYTEAVTNEARGFRIAGQLNDQHTLIAYLVAVAIRAIAVSGMRDILYLAGPNEDVGNRVAAAIRAAEPLSLKDAIAGEVAEETKSVDQMRDAVSRGLSVFDDEGTDAPAEQAKEQPLTPEQKVFVLNILDASEARYLAGVRAVVSSAVLPPAERRKRFAQLATAHPREESDSQVNPVKSMEAMMLGASTSGDKVDDTLHAREAVTIAAATLLAAKARTGAFPASLPDGFTDPFSGKALGYHTEGTDGFVVYSVGPDGKFDGGKPDRKTKSDQVLFRYPAPAQVPVPKNML